MNTQPEASCTDAALITDTHVRLWLAAWLWPDGEPAVAAGLTVAEFVGGPEIAWSDTLTKLANEHGDVPPAGPRGCFMAAALHELAGPAPWDMAALLDRPETGPALQRAARKVGRLDKDGVTLRTTRRGGSLRQQPEAEATP